MAEHANCDLIRRLYAARGRDDRDVRAISPEAACGWSCVMSLPDPATSDAFFEGGIDG
jgi:hypothetical protein